MIASIFASKSQNAYSKSTGHLGPIARALKSSRFGALLIVLQVALTLAIITNMAPIIVEKIRHSIRPSGIEDQKLAALTSLSLADAKTVNNEVMGPRAARERAVIMATPGVANATMMNSFPNSGGGWSSTMFKDVGEPGPNVARYFVDEHGIKTLGLKLLAGRDFLPQEIVDRNEANSPNSPQLIVTEMLAKELFKEVQSAIGKRVSLDEETGILEAEIIGVVGNVAAPWPIGEEYYSVVFEPFRNAGRNRWVIRAADGQDILKVATAANDALAKADRAVIYSATPRLFSESRKNLFASAWYTAGMLVVFGVLVCAITAFGMLGLTFFWITQRTRQIGIRRALGASRSDIQKYFRQENGLLTVIGCGLGIALAYSLNYVLAKELGAELLSPIWVLAGMTMLLLLGQIAVTFPARRAAMITPALASRTL